MAESQADRSPAQDPSSSTPASPSERVVRARIGRLWGWGRGRGREKESLGSLSVNHRSLYLRHTVQAGSEPGLSRNKGQEAEAGGDTVSDRRA